MNVFKFKTKTPLRRQRFFPKRCSHIIIESLAGSGFSIQCLKFWDEKFKTSDIHTTGLFAFAKIHPFREGEFKSHQLSTNNMTTNL
ncbi:hypothetical protein IX39_16900 [Chryseobacterium formosense]|uniref:Uncharacterized protein n=1 Tax=Chryseobacterium formosense TaxID=236814 RepID=A0A085Z0W0_9FLAO|nr:hypothetical protein IX39_16900 [Chryseobacterium formosense]SFT72812.1 hypothetical protein SAMN05421857_2787 [Chryseobacterium formosense]